MTRDTLSDCTEQFSCGDTCIPISQRCDGIDHCSRDELNCPGTYFKWIVCKPFCYNLSSIRCQPVRCWVQNESPSGLLSLFADVTSLFSVDVTVELNNTRFEGTDWGLSVIENMDELNVLIAYTTAVIYEQYALTNTTIDAITPGDLLAL